MILTAIANSPNRPVLLSRSGFIETRCRRRPERDAEDAIWHGEWEGGISLPQPTRIWKSVLNARGRAPAAHAFLALSERHRTHLVMQNSSGYTAENLRGEYIGACSSRYLPPPLNTALVQAHNFLPRRHRDAEGARFLRGPLLIYTNDKNAIRTTDTTLQKPSPGRGNMVFSAGGGG